MKRLSRRTETFADSVIRRMTRVCLKCGAMLLEALNSLESMRAKM